MELAPIVLFVYYRPWHTEQTLNALAANDLASESVLYIYADGPKDNAPGEVLENIKKTRDIVKSQKWCREVFIIESEVNKGLANSIISGVTEIVNKHGKIIVLEDDMITSTAFLRYMNESLKKFNDCEVIGSINACVDLSKDFNRLPPYFLLNGGDCWGWATWKDRWKEFIFDAATIKQKLINDKKLKEFDYGNTRQILDAQIKGDVNSWHIRWHGTQVLSGKLGLFPNKSYLINIGLDGTGTHSDFNTRNGDFNTADLNLYESPIQQVDLQSLLSNHKKAEATFKNLTLKKNKVNILSKIKNKIIREAKLLIDNFLYSRLDKVFTHLTKDEKRLLYAIAKKELPSNCTVVEIGSYLGASTNFIAKGIDDKSVIYCIDTWGNHAMKYEETDVDGDERDTYEDFKKNTQKQQKKIVMLRGWSTDMFSNLKELTSKTDFLFIDGDHSYEGVSKDWHLYSTLLKKNSIVAFHDTGWADGVNKVIKEDVLTQPVTLLHSLPNLQVYKITSDLHVHSNQ
ncbi:MAG TPA: class I SAM-dependent methyltransferase [Mucilaginibacter sp.]|jgi:predicted O-methyltransferase YrrM|nr:class I SAM-dependent methyltransferase [Mucilaginibacter sp.]